MTVEELIAALQETGTPDYTVDVSCNGDRRVTGIREVLADVTLAGHGWVTLELEDQ